MAEFAGAGAKEGVEVWRIENLAPVKQAGFTNKLFTGDSYIILVSTIKSNKLSYNVHFWLGAETSQDESGVAAYKTCELDNQCLSGRAVQYREVQGSESQLFLSYFKNGGIEYCPGGIASGFRKVEVDVYPTRLLQVKGKRSAKVSEVKLQLSSLNKSDAFILDKGLSIFVFCGPNANKFEKSKAVEVASRIDDNERGGRATVFFLDDNVRNADFWSEFGGFVDPASLPEGPPDEDVAPVKVPSSLFKISDASGVTAIASGKANLTKSLLNSDDVFFLIDPPQLKVFVWVGSGASVSEKREAMPRTLEHVKSIGLPSTIQVERMSEGQESSTFKSEFSSWPVEAAAVVEEVFDVKGTIKSKAQLQEVSVDDDGNGTVKVWTIQNMAKVEVPSSAHGQFNTGDSYIVHYTFTKRGTDNHLIYFWQGRESSADERGTAALLTKDLDDSLGGKAVQVRVVEGKEPTHFRQIFKGRMIVYTGGVKHATSISAGADTRDIDGIALFQVRGSNPLNAIAIQVREAAASLHSRDNFILVTPSDVFAWHGKFSNAHERDAALGYAHNLAGSYLGEGGRNIVEVSEENEPAAFWEYIGGKGEYSKVFISTDLPDPRLFECSTKTGRFKVEEIASFDQTDLNNEDVFLLDTGLQLFVWIGSQASKDEKEKAQSFGQSYVTEVGGDADVCLSIIHAGSEPRMFTEHFLNWDDNLFSSGFVDPYEAKLAAMKAKKGGASSSSGGGAPAVPLKKAPVGGVGIPVVIQPMVLPSRVAAPTEEVVPAKPAAAITSTLSYAELKAGVPAGVDPARKEEYLSAAEFQQVFGTDKSTFLTQPKWKRDTKKKEVGLF